MEFGINKQQLNTGRPIAMQCPNNVKKVKWPAAVDTGPFWNGMDFIKAPVISTPPHNKTNTAHPSSVCFILS